MTRVTIDAAMRDKLCSQGDMVEVCDESGQSVGNFYPALAAKSASMELARVTADPAMLDKLRTNGKALQLCDETGQIVGSFFQSSPPGTLRSPFSVEEIQRIRQEKGGRKLADFLKELGAE